MSSGRITNFGYVKSEDSFTHDGLRLGADKSTLQALIDQRGREPMNHYQRVLCGTVWATGEHIKQSFTFLDHRTFIMRVGVAERSSMNSRKRATG
jgi:hypothetical protein